MQRTRSEKIFGRIVEKLSAWNPKQITPNLIYATMDHAQEWVAEDMLCLESSLSLPVTLGVSEYNLTSISDTATGFYRLKHLSPPIGTTLFPVETDLPSAELLTRLSFINAGARTIFFRIWNKSLQLIPKPSSNATWTIFFYRTPLTQISALVNPETPSEFDGILEAWTLKEIALIAKPELLEAAQAMFNERYERALRVWHREKTSSNVIQFQD